MRHLDLFSGIGGFALAAQRVWGKEHKIITFCEIDGFCQKVLKKHWPNVPIIKDIKKLDGKIYNGNIELISGGFPCQPFSNAGHKRGTDDDRYLWPEMLRVIEEVEPQWVVGENVVNIANLALKEVLTSLEDLGYDTECYDIPACGIGAEHSRRRVWIIAHAKSRRLYPVKVQQRANIEINFRMQPFDSLLVDKECWYEPESSPNRTVDGLPETLDENRIKALGNAIVPQVAEIIFQAIKATSV